jgi:hypothetical protein
VKHLKLTTAASSTTRSLILVAAAGACFIAGVAGAEDDPRRLNICVRPDGGAYVSYGCHFDARTHQLVCHCGAPARPVVVAICGDKEASALWKRDAAQLRRTSVSQGELVSASFRGARLCIPPKDVPWLPSHDNHEPMVDPSADPGPSVGWGAPQ